MKNQYKKLGIIFMISVVVIFILTIIMNRMIERKIENALNDLPSHITVKYASIDSDVWGKSLKLKSANVDISGKSTSETILNADLKTIKINKLSFWDFLFNNKISVGAIEVDGLVSKYQHNSLIANKSYNKSLFERIKKPITIGRISLNNADLLITEHNTDSTLLSIPKYNLQLQNLKLNQNTDGVNTIVTHDSYTFNAKTVTCVVSDFDNLYVDSIDIVNKRASINNIRLETKYSKSELSSIIQTERDHMTIAINDAIIKELDFGFDDAKQFYLHSTKIILNTPIAEIYRDKLVADDYTIKHFYGKILRELDFNMGLESIEIENGKISYLEKVEAYRQAGRLDFSNVNAVVTNFGNSFGDIDTMIEVKAVFMENSPLEVDWNFKVIDTTDQFILKGDLGLLNAVQMNQFTKPNLNVGLTGELKQTYFTIGGNPKNSRIDLKVKYEDFKVIILQKNGKEKNRILSALVNLFVAKDSEDDKRNYRYGQSENVERDRTKSVFNFAWVNVKAGLLSAMAGDGEKDD